MELIDKHIMSKAFVAGEVSMPLMRIFKEQIHAQLAYLSASTGRKLAWVKSVPGFPAEAPEVLLSLGYDKTFVRLFGTRNSSDQPFQSFNEMRCSSQFQSTDDPAGVLTMYSGTPYVMLVDMRRLGPQPVPTCWYDLTNDIYRGEILAPGNEHGISSILLLHYYSQYGMEGLKRFAANVSACVHASWVCRSAHEGAVPYAVSIVPWMFAKCATLPETKIIWPDEGAIFSPMWMSVKKGCSPQAVSLARYIAMGEFAQAASRSFFPFADERVPNKLPAMNKLIWPGWRFWDEVEDIEQLQSRLKLESKNLWPQKMEYFEINKAS